MFIFYKIIFFNSTPTFDLVFSNFIFHKIIKFFIINNRFQIYDPIIFFLNLM